jgi:hypothetical protein
MNVGSWHRKDGLFNAADGRLAAVKRPLSRERRTAARDPFPTSGVGFSLLSEAEICRLELPR